MSTTHATTRIIQSTEVDTRWKWLLFVGSAIAVCAMLYSLDFGPGKALVDFLIVVGTVLGLWSIDRRPTRPGLWRLAPAAVLSAAILAAGFSGQAWVALGIAPVGFIAAEVFSVGRRELKQLQADGISSEARPFGLKQASFPACKRDLRRYEEVRDEVRSLPAPTVALENSEKAEILAVNRSGIFLFTPIEFDGNLVRDIAYQPASPTERAASDENWMRMLHIYSTHISTHGRYKATAEDDQSVNIPDLDEFVLRFADVYGDETFLATDELAVSEFTANSDVAVDELLPAQTVHSAAQAANRLCLREDMPIHIVYVVFGARMDYGFGRVRIERDGVLFGQGWLCAPGDIENFLDHMPEALTQDSHVDAVAQGFKTLVNKPVMTIDQ